MTTITKRGERVFFGFLALIYVVLAAFACILAFFWRTPFAGELMSLFFSPFFPPAGPEPATLRFCAFVFGVLGALMLSWVVLMASLAFGPLRRGQSWAGKALLGAALAWFCIDESFSLYYRVYANALGNLLILSFLVVPVLFLLSQAKRLPAESESQKTT